MLLDFVEKQICLCEFCEKFNLQNILILCVMFPCSSKFKILFWKGHMYLSRDRKLQGALPPHQWRIKEFSKEEVDSFILIKSYRGLNPYQLLLAIRWNYKTGSTKQYKRFIYIFLVIEYDSIMGGRIKPCKYATAPVTVVYLEGLFPWTVVASVSWDLRKSC